jgi:hypothetical protein
MMIFLLGLMFCGVVAVYAATTYFEETQQLEQFDVAFVVYWVVFGAFALMVVMLFASGWIALLGVLVFVMMAFFASLLCGEWLYNQYVTWVNNKINKR